MDIWVESVAENAKRAYATLVEFGAPMADLTVHDLTQPRIVFQFGMAPTRVDVMTTIDAVTFPEAWKNRVETHLSGIPISIISLQAVSYTHLDVYKRQRLSLVEEAALPETPESTATGEPARVEAVRRMLEFGERHRLSLGEPITRKLLHDGHRL